MLRLRRNQGCEGRIHELPDFRSEIRSDRSHPRQAHDALRKEEAVPAAEEKEQQAVPIEMTWGMFAQAIVGQRVTTSQGNEIMKLAVVSFPIPPGVEDKGAGIIEHVLGKKSNGIMSFNDDGTLLASFGRSQDNLDQFGIFSKLYEAGGMIIDRHHPDKDHENLDYFRRFQDSRQSKIPELIADVKELLSVPQHTMRSAMADADFGGAFRQEWMLVNGKIMATNIEGHLQELTAALGTQEEGHAAWLEWLVNYINTAFESGARSIIGLQVDSTTTVKGCGGSDEANAFYNRSVGGADVTLSAENAYLNWISSAFGLGGGSVGSGSAGGGGDGAFTATQSASHNCRGCGNAVDKDINVCPSCRTKGQHAGAHN